MDTLLGVVVGAVLSWLSTLLSESLTSRRETTQRRHQYVERQLRELYSPLLGIRSEIRALGEVRLKVRVAADEAYREMIGRQMSPETKREISEKIMPEFRKINQYENEQLRQHALPAYRRMVTIFRDTLWLAEPETREHFGTLVEFVDLWDRSLDNTLPYEVGDQLSADESRLQPFYEHIERMHDKLRDELKQGKA